MGQALSKLAIAKAYVVDQCVATCSECLNLLLYGAHECVGNLCVTTIQLYHHHQPFILPGRSSCMQQCVRTLLQIQRDA